jgi:hypothetical protein
VAAAEHPSFDELLDLLRVRLGDADTIEPSELHSFKELMADQAHMIGEQWYWNAFDELEAQGHLDRASFKANHGDAHARLSADGRLYLRSSEST